MLLYTTKLRVLKTSLGDALWRRWRTWRGADVGHADRLPELIRQYAPGHSFVDVGSLWRVDGEHAFIAEAAGATAVKAVDVYGPTAAFEAKRRSRGSAVEFVLGDATRQETVTQVGPADVVFCTGVLYHHPSPFDLLVALRRMCKKTLILRTFSIPEVPGLPQAAVYFPLLSPDARRVWSLDHSGRLVQCAVNTEFRPEEGYGNWFWGATPSCVAALLQTAGFRIDRRLPEPLAHTFICSPIAAPFEHPLPDEETARLLPTGRPAPVSSRASAA